MFIQATQEETGVFFLKICKSGTGYQLSGRHDRLHSSDCNVIYKECYIQFAQ